MGTKINKLALGVGLLAASSAATAAENQTFWLFGVMTLVYSTSKGNNGMMGYETPNIDRIANEGALFTDHYGQQSCTAGRAAFLTGQEPFRTGLLIIGASSTTVSLIKLQRSQTFLKNKATATAQFGKNHMGDQDKHLPTNHGFDQFFGNLYHLNAEEEPETYYYPKDPWSSVRTLALVV